MPATISQQALRFYGGGISAPDADRVKIRIDDVDTNAPGPPVDVGAVDFTIEFWMKGDLSNNTSTSVSCGLNNNWINGNIIIDRDRFNQDQNYGISIAGGLVVFGVGGDGTGFMTLCGTTQVLDNKWHHVVTQRRRSDGYLWLYVDGILEAQGDGPDGDISYPDDGIPCSTCCGGSTCNFSDPYIVLGAEKHDAGAAYPSYNGLMDELRFSNTLRYVTDFSPPAMAFTTDTNTVALYHFDEGSGTTVGDASNAVGGPSDGQMQLGGLPLGPMWVMDSPFSCSGIDSNRWTGLMASGWHDDPSNWSLNRIPSMCDQVVIENNRTVQVQSGQSAVAGGLEVAAGSVFQVLLGAQLTVQ